MSYDNRNSESSAGRSYRRVFGYLLMVGLTVAAFFLIRAHGESLPPPGVDLPEPSSAATTSNTLLRVLIALASIVVLSQILARLFRFVGQPPVIGEVVAGILLGPSLIGAELSANILPPAVAPQLAVIAQLGVVLFMFIVGLELNPKILRQHSHTTLVTSLASILFPFILGAALAIYLYPRFVDHDESFTTFALFMGVAMSITAFPVLARILTDYRMNKSSLGVMALSCAAVNDAVAWCLLALVVGVAKAQLGQAFVVMGGALAFVAFMFVIARPMIEWATARFDDDKYAHTTAILAFGALLLSATCAEAIGIHAIFGAFLLGVIIPHDSRAAHMIISQTERVVTILLLPAFFALTGMRARIDLLSEPGHWLVCGLIVLVATVGKFGGTYVAARVTGLNRRAAAMLGTLMNTRGLMELIVLNVGLELGVISPTIFSMMVVMALVTTALTSPVLQLLKARPADPTEPDMLVEAQASSFAMVGKP